MSSYTTSSAGVSKYTAERHQRILLELLQQPGNDICADCKSRAPRWSSWNLGIFICVQCASIHRKIGTHVTKVKSVNLDAWTKEQVESVKNMGNIASNAKWNPNEARNPPPTNLEESERDSEMEKYIRAKYETKRFLDRKTVAPSTSSSNTVAPGPASSVPIPRRPKPEPSEPVDPSQTVPLGFGRESRVEFSLGGSGVGDLFDGFIQQKKVPPRSHTAPIPEPPKPTPPPVPNPPVPAIPSRSVSTQPPNPVQAPMLGANTTASAIQANGVWGDLLAIQTGGPLPATTQAQPSLTQQNPYASLSVSANVPSALANKFNPARSFTAPTNAAPPNPFFNQAQMAPQQPMPTGSTGSNMFSVPTGGSFGSIGSGSLGSVPTGGSFGSVGSMSGGSFGAGGMGTSPGGAFSTNPFGASLGVSQGGAFGTSPAGAQTSAFGATSNTFGTSMLSPTSQQVTSPLSQQPTGFQQNTLSPFGSASSMNMGASPNATSLSAFGAAMSPPGQASNSPYAQASNSPFGQAGTQFAGGNSPFQTNNPGFQSQFQQPTPTNNAFLQANNAMPFQQQSGSPFQPSNSPFQQSNSPYQATQGNNPFGTFNAQGGGMNTNPFGQQQQFQYQGQQGWGGM